MRFFLKEEVMLEGGDATSWGPDGESTIVNVELSNGSYVSPDDPPPPLLFSILDKKPPTVLPLFDDEESPLSFRCHRIGILDNAHAALQAEPSSSLTKQGHIVPITLSASNGYSDDSSITNIYLTE